MSAFIPRPRAPVSLKRQWVRLLVGVAGLFFFGIALSLGVSLYDTARNEARELAHQITLARVNLTRRMDYYRALIDKMVRAPELLDLMRVGTYDDQYRWALSRQRLLPDLLGLALIDARGEVRGDAAELRVGTLCQVDLRRAQDPAAMRPLLHREIAGLEHIDLIGVARDTDGRMLGGVFVSLRLSQLQRVLDDSVQPGHALAVVDSTGQVIVSSGAVRGAVREMREEIPDTGWTLIARSPRRVLTLDGGMQILVGLLTLTAVLLLLGTTLMRLRRTLLRDIDATRDALAALARDETVPKIVPYYAEFEPAVADINRIALNLRDQRVRLEYLSLTDPLTGLPNRRAFENHFAQAQGLAVRGHRVALVLLDVDHFKAVNDTLGHGVGDQVLRALAESLKTLTRRADLAARFAGDEFVVLLNDVEAEGLEPWYRRLSDCFRSQLDALGMDVRAGLSAGQTWLGKTPDETIDDALGRADRALYQAKARGRGQLATEPAE